MRLTLQNQTLRFIPNQTFSGLVSLVIYNKSKRKEVYLVKNLTTTSISHYFELSFNVTLKEGENYIVEVKQFASQKQAFSYVQRIANDNGVLTTSETDVISKLDDVICEGGVTLYRALAFATNNNLPYSINEGNYKEHASNNEYIILDNE